MIINYEQILNDITQKVLNNDLKYENTIIIGDNSVGKTELLKRINSNYEKSILLSCPIDKDIFSKDYNNVDLVLIDNIETILEFKDILNIENILNNNFKDKKLVIVTHNTEIISNLKNFNLINIFKDSYCTLDINDFNSISDVYDLINSDKSAFNNILVNLLNLKIQNNWTIIEEERLSNIQKELLNSSQTSLYNQILNF